MKIIKAAKSSLVDGHYVVTEYDTTYTRQDCDVSFEASYNLNKRLSEANLKSQINQISKDFMDGVSSELTGPLPLVVSESYDVNQLNGNSSSSRSFSSAHTSNSYKVTVGPYLGKAN